MTFSAPQRPVTGELPARVLTPQWTQEIEYVHALARKLAALHDTGALLTELCESVLHLAHADGSAVVRIEAHELCVEAVAGSGTLRVGSKYPLAGSLAQSAISRRRLVIERDYASRATAQPLTTMRGPIGEILAAPLIAAKNDVLGVLLSWRARAAGSFLPADIDRVQLFADFAAIILDKSQLAERAQAANQAKSAFLATLSHELRTPVAALVGYGELLSDGVAGSLNPSQRDLVERMRSVTDQLSAIIDQLLSFSAIEGGREIVRPSTIAVGELLAAIAIAVDPMARRKGLKVILDFAASPESIESDFDKVRRILVSLAENAVKFTDSGQVTLAAIENSGMIRFEVRDTGPGIPREAHRRIFEPFAQLEPGLTRRHGGTGLGLFIAQRLAGLLGGCVQLQSELGAGSTFTLLIPTHLDHE
ncbi:MAG TPA: HAMP domain-containing sensor histidine kinase [Gemmatimonadaceae bacterium]|nr:HAMP domain-containing sensor histidine kinase [Gemmatimonadaceae bacterium]